MKRAIYRVVALLMACCMMVACEGTPVATSSEPVSQAASEVTGENVALDNARTVVVSETKGEVTAAGMPAYKGQRLRVGDTMTTGAGAMASVTLDDNKLFTLDQGTTLRIDEVNGSQNENQTTLMLIKGTVLNSVPKLATGSNYVVKTRNSTMGVRGTVFIVTVGDDGIPHIVVFEGIVAAKNIDTTDPDLDDGLWIYPQQQVDLTDENIAKYKDKANELPKFVPSVYDDELLAKVVEELIKRREEESPDKKPEIDDTIIEIIGQKPGVLPLLPPEVVEQLPAIPEPPKPPVGISSLPKEPEPPIGTSTLPPPPPAVEDDDDDPPPPPPPALPLPDIDFGNADNLRATPTLLVLSFPAVTGATSYDVQIINATGKVEKEFTIAATTTFAVAAAAADPTPFSDPPEVEPATITCEEKLENLYGDFTIKVTAKGAGFSNATTSGTFSTLQKLEGVAASPYAVKFDGLPAADIYKIAILPATTSFTPDMLAEFTPEEVPGGGDAVWYAGAGAIFGSPGQYYVYLETTEGTETKLSSSVPLDFKASTKLLYNEGDGSAVYIAVPDSESLATTFITIALPEAAINPLLNVGGEFPYTVTCSFKSGETVLGTGDFEVSAWRNELSFARKGEHVKLVDGADVTFSAVLTTGSISYTVDYKGKLVVKTTI